MDNKFKEKFGKHLGQVGSYAVKTDKHDPSLLVPIPREVNRKPLGINPSKLEMKGCDLWHCHEATFLLETGEPVAGTVKLLYDSDSPNIVESKSIKLYFNSFDMEVIPGLKEEAVNQYTKFLSDELSEVIGSKVLVNFFDFKHDLGGGTRISDLCQTLQLEVGDTITDYEGRENHLVFTKTKEERVIKAVSTNILRSRCHITSQKDTGTAVIFYQEKKGQELNTGSLLKQIVSLREVNEFHELCCEKLFKDIMSTGKIDRLMVVLLYSRRGSLDINPIRSNIKFSGEGVEGYISTILEQSYLSVNSLTPKEMGQ